MNASWWDTPAAAAAAAPRPGVGRSPAAERVSDADRERVAAVVRDATVDGLFQFDEMDDRLGSVFRARTVAELDATVADLPHAWLARREVGGRAAATTTWARESFRWHLRAYLAGMALMVGIWLTLALVLGVSYPWPIWPALGWGESAC